MSGATLPRIAWLTSEFFPPETGGTGMVAGRLSQGLAARGFDIQVWTRQTLPRASAQELVGSVRVRRLEPAGGTKGAGWRAFPMMLSFIARLTVLLVRERGRYDLMVVSGMKTIPLTAVPIGRLLGKRCVVRIESPFEIVEPISAESLALMNGALGRLLSRALQVLQRWVLRRATRVVAISQDIADQLARIDLPPVNIVRIANAVDLSKFKPVPAERHALRAALGLPIDRTLVLYVGRLSRAKGILMLIEAWPALVARHPAAYLVIVGSGKGSWDDCEADINAQVQQQRLEPFLQLAGHTDQVHEYLQCADLFVSPSDYEGFGLTLVEALSCGVPAVTTSVGIAPEIIREGINGYSCPPKDPAALSAALDLALSRTERWPEMGVRARASVQQFDLPMILDRYAAVLGDITR